MYLLTPHQLANLRLPNRTVMAPMTRSRASLDGVPHELTALYYAQRASAGLIITEGIYVSAMGKGYVATAGLHTDEQQHAWCTVTDAVHTAGGRIYAQLVHVGRMSHPHMLPAAHDGRPAAPLAPSAVKASAEVVTANGPAGAAEPRALELAEITDIIIEFTQAAQRAMDAGFDGVELHAGNGFLLHQFLASGTNQRADSYGGSVANRIRLPFEVAHAVAGAIGAEKVGVRLSPNNPDNDMNEDDADDVYPVLAAALNDIGIAYLHVINDGSEPVKLLRPRFDGTLIANGVPGGSPTDMEAAEKALTNGADLVAFGRAFLANPDLPTRLAFRTTLNKFDYATAYGGDHRGYTDYATLTHLSA